MSRLLPMRLERLGFSAGGRRLLDGIELSVPPGLVTLVLGPNGAGKSLLLRACHGLIRPDQGRIVTGLGHGIGRRERALQAMVFQRPVHLRRSALANLTWTLAAKGLGGRRRGEIAREALARFGLAPLAHSPARRLSGGEQQRLALARAWLQRPQLLILDEPTAALDPAGAKAVEEALQAFVAEGTAVLISTHDLHQARRLAEKIAFLHAGRLLEAGSADRFFTNPLTAEAAAYLRGELIVTEPATEATPCPPAA